MHAGEWWHLMNGDELIIWVNLHAILMVAVVLGALALLILARRRRPRPATILVASIIALFTCMIGTGFHHACIQGQPVMQWMIPSGCIWVILLFVAGRLRKLIASTLLFVAMIVMCQQYSRWVHEDGWTGDIEAMRGSAINRQRVMISRAENFLADRAATNAAHFPACWMKDLPPVNADRESYKLYLGNHLWLGDYIRLWHSSFTRLYRAKAGTDRDLWYLGGPIKDAKGRIVVRERQ